MAANDRIAGVILAGGRSQRMGNPKALVQVRGMTLLERVIERARPQVAALLLNVNGDHASFASFGLPTRSDGISGFAGPLAGILAGLEWASDDGRDFEWVASFPVDTPLLPPDLVPRLAEAIVGTGSDLAIAASAGRHHPVIGLWPVRLAAELRRALAIDGVRKVEDWTGRNRTAIAEWPGGSADPFFNVNTPEELEQVERRLEQRSPS